MTVRYKHIRRITETLLDQNKIYQAPVDVEDIAAKMGLDVHASPTDMNISGFLLRDVARRRAAIGVNNNHSVNRQRFTIAHEIGHFLLHEGDVHFDRVDGSDQGLRLNFRSDSSIEGSDESEIEANVFAAELLMPLKFLAKDVVALGPLDMLSDNDDQLKALAGKYRVSSQALTFRLVNLGYISL